MPNLAQLMAKPQYWGSDLPQSGNYDLAQDYLDAVAAYQQAQPWNQPVGAAPGAMPGPQGQNNWHAAGYSGGKSAGELAALQFSNAFNAGNQQGVKSPAMGLAFGSRAALHPEDAQAAYNAFSLNAEGLPEPVLDPAILAAFEQLGLRPPAAPAPPGGPDRGPHIPGSVHEPGGPGSYPGPMPGAGATQPPRNGSGGPSGPVGGGGPGGLPNPTEPQFQLPGPPIGGGPGTLGPYTGGNDLMNYNPSGSLLSQLPNGMPGSGGQGSFSNPGNIDLSQIGLGGGVTASSTGWQMGNPADANWDAPQREWDETLRQWVPAGTANQQAGQIDLGQFDPLSNPQHVLNSPGIKALLQQWGLMPKTGTLPPVAPTMGSY